MSQSADNSRAEEWGRQVRGGRVLDFGGPPTMRVTSDLLCGLYDAFVSPVDALHQVGWGWGRAFGARLEGWIRQFHASLDDLPLDDLLILIQDELTRSGWGRVTFDLERFSASGMILANVVGGPISALEAPVADGVANLLAGFLAGTLGAAADLPMEGIGRCLEEANLMYGEILVGHQALINRIRGKIKEQLPWNEALADELTR